MIRCPDFRHFTLLLAGVLASALHSAAPRINALNNLGGTVGQPFHFKVSAVDPVDRWEVTGLPGFLTFDPATGWVTGTPEAPGTFTFSISASNGDGASSQSVAAEIFPATAGVGRYPHGLTPTRANLDDVLERYREWKTRHLQYRTNGGKPEARVGSGTYTSSEYQGYGATLAAHLEEDDVLLESLWNFAWTSRNTGKGNLMSWRTEDWKVTGAGVAPDGIVDLAEGMDQAARRWPGSSWAQRAENYIKAISQHVVRDSTLTLGGNEDGLYINYFSMAYYDRWIDRVGLASRLEGSRSACYDIMQYSWDHYFLPAWYVDSVTGEGQTPNDPWNSGMDRWDTGPTRTGWRVPQHYHWTGDVRAYRWAKRIYDVYASYGKLRTQGMQRLGTSYSFQSGRQKNGSPADSFMAGTAGLCAMAVGDQAAVDAAWDYLVVLPFTGDSLKDTIHVLYLLALSGYWDLGLETPPDTLWDSRYIAGIDREWVLTWAGWLWYDSGLYPWTYSYGLGWVHPVGHSPASVFLYTAAGQWFWTGRAYWPWYLSWPEGEWRQDPSPR